MKLLKFSLRDLLWLVLVAALCIGWWQNSIQLQAEIKAALAANEQAELTLANARISAGMESKVSAWEMEAALAKQKSWLTRVNDVTAGGPMISGDWP